MAIEEISLLVGHRSSSVTETINRYQIRPVITTGAEAMDKIFAKADVSHDRIGCRARAGL